MEEYQLGSLLPADTITYNDNNTQSCIDLCYGTQDLVDRVVKCGVDNEMDHNSDHLPIITILDLRTRQRQQTETRDWSSIDGKELRANLARELPAPRCPKSTHALDRYVREVARAIQSAIEHATPLKRWSSRARVGWTSECKETQAEARRLKRRNARLHTDESWEAYRVARNKKGRVIRKALLQGHRNQIESAMKSPESMWKLAKHTPQPSHKILRLHLGLKKWQSALLIQMRTEKIGLRDFLWKRRVPEFDDPGCDCGEGRQTVDHVLLRCRTYNDLRRRVFGRGRRIDLRAVLNEPKLVTKAIKFIEQTRLLGQFRSCDAEQRDEVEH